MPIYFHSEVQDFSFTKKRILKEWLKRVILNEKRIPGELNIIIVSDDALLKINKKYLKHDYFTDIITFNYNNGNIVSGDIYISMDRVLENALKLHVSDKTELNRVIAHGVLHLLGYNDETKEQKEEIRKMEDSCLNLL